MLNTVVLSNYPHFFKHLTNISSFINLQITQSEVMVVVRGLQLQCFFRINRSISFFIREYSAMNMAILFIYLFIYLFICLFAVFIKILKFRDLSEPQTLIFVKIYPLKVTVTFERLKEWSVHQGAHAF